ncbi:MAG: hypothetical protein ACJA0Q_000170 [Saprospiraceae bacterium]|jgi:hypothetical protein
MRVERREVTTRIQPFDSRTLKFDVTLNVNPRFLGKS